MKSMNSANMSLVGLVLLVPLATTAEVRLDGPYGARLDRMIRNHVAATDAVKLASLFGERVNTTWWQTEFWGKYMHSAVPFWNYSGSRELGERIEAGLVELLKHQEPNGYIGNYPEKLRFGRGWDVWGMKYTMMGLLHYYDYASRLPSAESRQNADRALDACRRLCDYLAGELERRKMPLRFTGNYGGMPSCSVLEPVVWLYNRIRLRQEFGGQDGARKYLDFASAIVDEMSDKPDGPQLVKLASVPVAERRFGVVPVQHKWAPELQLTKAYEMMSCYQGLLEYWEATGRKRGDLLDATIASARSIADTEINLAGGAAAGEHWYHGADRQWQHISWLQETCVVTTWMRLCEKLLAVTGDTFWADQLEKTFYNIYLAAMNVNCDTFAAYTPLMGYKSPGHNHCRMHTNCCNANGPRGWLAFMNVFFTAEGDSATMNFYMSSRAEAKLGDGRQVAFKCYTLYPCDGHVAMRYCGGDADFSLRLRIPNFSEKTQVKVNGKSVGGEVRAGTYFQLRRKWHEGDEVEAIFSLPVKMHRLHDHVAFTRGPVCLARDTRFNDGALDEEIRADKITEACLAAFRRVKSPDPSMMLSVAAALPTGSHTENFDNGVYDSVVHFTDYASAGNLWREDCRYRVWLPELIPGRPY